MHRSATPPDAPTSFSCTAAAPASSVISTTPSGRTRYASSFVAKGVLPYRGLGSGVPRALEAWPDIDFRDDRDGGLFVATVRRKALAPGDLAVDADVQRTTQKTTQKILGLVAQDPSLTRQPLAEALGITEDGVKYHLRKLQKDGLLRRVGPDKGGHWEVTAGR